MDRLRNEHGRGTTQVDRFVDKVRGQVEKVWTCAEEGGWLYRRDVESSAARQEERPKRRRMDVVLCERRSC